MNIDVARLLCPGARAEAQRRACRVVTVTGNPMNRP